MKTNYGKYKTTLGKCLLLETTKRGQLDTRLIHFEEYNMKYCKNGSIYSSKEKGRFYEVLG
jgi:hypothetical protein